MENFVQLSQNSFVVSVNGRTVALSRSDLSRCDAECKEKKTSIVSLLGLFEVAGKHFAVASTKVSSVCELWGINKIDSFEVFQISSGNEDTEAKMLLKKGLGLSVLYYSTSVDLSLNLGLQKRKSTPRKHFIWNGIAIDNFNKAAHEENFVQPVIAGFMTSFQAPKFQFALISRRSAVCAGTRFWMRGADAEGNAANFVETEQIVVTEKETYSFTQIRGSVPLHWTQYPDLSRLPSLRLASKDENEEVLNKHFKKLVDEYGKVIAVSLTDHKGRELELTETYNELGGKAPDVQYQYFDFHKECAKMKYQNIQHLIDSIAEGLNAEEWTQLNADKTQKGVVRTNCVDCLDRTNVVQSTIARRIIDKQLEDAGCVCDYEQNFRNAWTDNADFISIQYSGTPALKTDFTRTGKRTTKGALNDGVNSISRFYINTCTDGTRQDAYDVVTQSVSTKNINKENFFVSLILAVFMMLSALFLIISGQKVAGKKKMLNARMKLVNAPRFRQILPAEKKPKSQ